MIQDIKSETFKYLLFKGAMSRAKVYSSNKLLVSKSPADFHCLRFNDIDPLRAIYARDGEPRATFM